MEIIGLFLNQPLRSQILIVYVLIVFYIIYKDGKNKWRKRLKGCPVSQLQEDLRWAARKERQMMADHKRQVSELQASNEQDRKKLEREKSYLRSRLYK